MLMTWVVLKSRKIDEVASSDYLTCIIFGYLTGQKRKAGCRKTSGTVNGGVFISEYNSRILTFLSHIIHAQLRGDGSIAYSLLYRSYASFHSLNK